MQIGTASFPPNLGSTRNPDVSTGVDGLDRVAATGERTAPSRSLKVLVVSTWFPPANVIGAIRVGHFAKSFYESGHDVRVLTAQHPGDQSLPLAFPADRVIYIQAPRSGESLDRLVSPPLKLIRRLTRAISKPAGEATVPLAQPPAGSNSTQRNLRRHYYAM